MSSTLSMFLRTSLGVIDFYSIRVATLLSSGLAVRSIARSSVALLVVSLFLESLIEFIVDFNRSPL